MPRPSVFDTGHRYVHELRRFRRAVAGVPPQPGMTKAGHLQLLRLALLGKPRFLNRLLPGKAYWRHPHPERARAALIAAARRRREAARG